MPNHGKGGRKPEGDEPKRSAVAVRTTPAIKALLVAAANEAGRSVTQEIEARLEASLAEDRPNRTPETMRLLAGLAEDIERAEHLTGRRWHKDVVTWAMVREALASGEIERQCPEFDRWATDTDGDVHNRFVEIVQIEARQNYDIDTLGELGAQVEVSGAYTLDRTLPRFNFAATRAFIDENVDERMKDAARLFLARVEKEDARRIELAKANKEQWRWLAEAIVEGVTRWNADLETRGISKASEYRPSARLAPARPAVGLAQNLNRLFGLAETTGKRGSATLGSLTKGDDNAA